MRLPLLQKILFTLLEVAMFPVTLLPKPLQFRIVWPILFLISGLGKFTSYYLAQSGYETATPSGLWTSGVYLKGNNPSGMKPPTIRPSWGVVPGGEIGLEDSAVYRNVFSGALDMILRHKYFKVSTYVITDLESFISALKATGYFTQDEALYLAGTQSTLDKLKEDNQMQLVYTGLGIVLLVGLSLSLFFLVKTVKTGKRSIKGITLPRIFTRRSPRGKKS